MKKTNRMTAKQIYGATSPTINDWRKLSDYKSLPFADPFLSMQNYSLVTIR